MRTVLSCMRDVCAPTAISVEAYSARKSVASFSFWWMSWSVFSCIVLVWFDSYPVLCRCVLARLACKVLLQRGLLGATGCGPGVCAGSHSAVPNGPSCDAKQAVLAFGTARLGVHCGLVRPAPLPLSGSFARRWRAAAAWLGKGGSEDCLRERLQNYAIPRKRQNVGAGIFCHARRQPGPAMASGILLMYGFACARQLSVVSHRCHGDADNMSARWLWHGFGNYEVDRRRHRWQRRTTETTIKK